MVQYYNSIETASANQSGAMEADTISKNGRSSKSHMSRGNIFQFVLLTIAAILIFSSCSKDKEIDTTYTFKYTVSDASGVVVDVIIFEYNDAGERVGQQSFDECVKGFSKTITANSKATKLKIRVTLTAGSVSLVRWIREVFYLEVGKNVDVEIKDSTAIAENEP